MKKTIGCLSLLLCVPHALACTQLPAVTAFVILNDKDGNKVLDWQEWQHADNIHQQFELDFQLHEEGTFQDFDYNQNGELEPREIGFERVRYVTDPCHKYLANEEKH